MIKSGSGSQNSLARCLNTIDLTALGIGSTLGSGIYVVAGQVARSVAGPSVILSFVIAAIASVLAGLCYAEFGARVPRAGSAYIYSYVTVGEFWAFIIGWNLILEYVIGTASVARATSAFIDSLAGNAMSSFLTEHLPIRVSLLSSYPDLLALAFTLVLTIILCFGVKESSLLNNVFTLVNICVVAYVMICGCFKLNFDNWHLPKHSVDNTTVLDEGGFFPFGVSGMLSGSATCFYAFVGFDVIATTGEEVINPEKAIPISIILCLLVCAIGYIGISAILTLMVPYYLLNSQTPLSSAFGSVGWYVAENVIAIGAICSLTTCLLTSMFPMPRIIYAMSRDGLLFRFLAKVSQRFKTPIIATLVSGLLAGVMAMLFELSELVDMMSIGTLLAYTLVSVCVLILRYEDDGSTVQHIQEAGTSSESAASPVNVFPCTQRNATPTIRTSRIVKISVAFASLLTIWLGLVEIYLAQVIYRTVWWALLLLLLPIVLLVICAVVIWSQPQSTTSLPFRVPFVPFVPLLSIVMNIYLMLKLSNSTWIRFAVWLVIGFAIYFGYGIRHANNDPEVDDDEDALQSEPRIEKVELPNERSHLLPSRA